MRSWLRLDALNRTWRTLLQGAAVTIVIPAADAAWQVIQRAALDRMAGQPFDWGQVGNSAAGAAVTAALMAVAAWLHRAKVDPSRIPSAEPPRPPGTTEIQAPATAPVGPATR